MKEENNLPGMFCPDPILSQSLMQSYITTDNNKRIENDLMYRSPIPLTETPPHFNIKLLEDSKNRLESVISKLESRLFIIEEILIDIRDGNRIKRETGMDRS